MSDDTFAGDYEAARARFEAGEYREAAALFVELVDRSALELVDSRDDHYALLLLGRTLQRQSRHDEARPHLAMAKLLGGYDIEGPDLPEG